MCTAINISGEYDLFGRTLDLERSYGESLVITPRGFGLDFMRDKVCAEHLAMIGIACVRGGVPLYYDAVNESGLAMAGLNFPISARYRRPVAGKRNVASFELIPRILGYCRELDEATEMLGDINITDDSFSEELPATPLHWMLSKGGRAIAVESVEEGMRIYDAPFGVLTNEPSFPYHMTHLCDYSGLSASAAENKICPQLDLLPYSRGMGAIGLPGDLSSASRFVRAVFAAANTTACGKEGEISRFFHVADSVAVPKGCIRTEEGREVLTVYTSCANTDDPAYYFTTYGCRRIRGARLGDFDLSSREISALPMERNEDILYLLQH